MSYGLSRLSESYLDDPEEVEYVSDNTGKKLPSPSLSPKTKPVKTKEVKPVSDSVKKGTEEDLKKEDVEKKKEVKKVETKPEKKPEEKKTEDKNEKNKTEKKKLDDSKETMETLSNGVIDDNIDKTPNTDEYRSNWESEEEMLFEILPLKNLDKSWGSEGDLLDIDPKKRKKARDDDKKLIDKKKKRRSSSIEAKSRRSHDKDIDKKNKRRESVERRDRRSVDNKSKRYEDRKVDKKRKSRFDDEEFRIKSTERVDPPEESGDNIEKKKYDSEYDLKKHKNDYHNSRDSKGRYDNPKGDYRGRYDKPKDENVDLRAKYDELRNKYQKRWREECTDRFERFPHEGEEHYKNWEPRREEFVERYLGF